MFTCIARLTDSQPLIYQLVFDLLEETHRKLRVLHYLQEKQRRTLSFHCDLLGHAEELMDERMRISYRARNDGQNLMSTCTVTSSWVRPLRRHCEVFAEHCVKTATQVDIEF